MIPQVKRIIEGFIEMEAALNKVRNDYKWTS